MGYIPGDARWFYATLVIKIIVEGDPRTVVHESTVLVEAGDRETAFVRAMELGAQHNYEDVNPIGRKITQQFVGLRELDVIHDNLEHGAELFFAERIGLSEEEIGGRVCNKQELGAFRQSAQVDKPDYSSIDVMADVRKVMCGSGGKEPSN